MCLMANTILRFFNVLRGSKNEVQRKRLASHAVEATERSGAEQAFRAVHLTLIIPSLTAGGAERVMCNMANYWAANGREVTLITFDSEATDFYSLNPEVKRVALRLVRT